MKLKQLIIGAVMALSALGAASKTFVQQDWGTVATPLVNEVSYSFAQYDIKKNRTDHYLFSLEGNAKAIYSVLFEKETCRKGCGNPQLSYGIYDRKGGLVESENGSVTLSAGNYAFQVKGTGFGSGNSFDYWGTVTFGADPSVVMVSPTPEPSTWLMMLMGLVGLGWSARRWRGVQFMGVPA